MVLAEVPEEDEEYKIEWRCKSVVATLKRSRKKKKKIETTLTCHPPVIVNIVTHLSS